MKIYIVEVRIATHKIPISAESERAAKAYVRKHMKDIDSEVAEAGFSIVGAKEMTHPSECPEDFPSDAICYGMDEEDCTIAALFYREGLDRMHPWVDGATDEEVDRNYDLYFNAYDDALEMAAAQFDAARVLTRMG